MALTKIQKETLALLLEADPDPVRGGMGSGGVYRRPYDDRYPVANSTTLSSLEGRGFVARAAAPSDVRRVNARWFRLTDSGKVAARRSQGWLTP